MRFFTVADHWQSSTISVTEPVSQPEDTRIQPGSAKLGRQCLKENTKYQRWNSGDAAGFVGGPRAANFCCFYCCCVIHSCCGTKPPRTPREPIPTAPFSSVCFFGLSRGVTFLEGMALRVARASWRHVESDRCFYPRINPILHVCNMLVCKR